MLDLALRVLYKTQASSAGPQTKAIAENTRELGEVFRAYPMAGSVAKNYSKRVWALTEALENANDFQGSADLMKTAAGLFDALRAAKISETDVRGAELRRFGHMDATIFYRRLGWIRTTHLNDLPGALEAADAALMTAKAGLAELDAKSGAYLNLRWEYALAEETKANALVLAGKSSEAAEAYRRSLAAVEELLARDIRTDFRPDAENEQRYLHQQLARIGSPVPGGP
jgi:hypothetical protein